MSSESEGYSVLGRKLAEGDKFDKDAKILYTRNFLLSLADLDTCKGLPRKFDPSILRELDDLRVGLSFSLTDPDSVRSHRGLAPHTRQNSQHGILGGIGSPSVSGCVALASTPQMQGHARCVLMRSDQPYRPPHFYKAKPHSRRENNDLNNDETFGSSELPSQEKAEEERRKRELFELLRKEHQRSTQEKKNKIADEHKENLDPDIAVLVTDSRADRRLSHEPSESEDCMVPPDSDDNSMRHHFCTQTFTSRKHSTGFKTRSLDKNLGTIPLIRPPVPKPLEIKADQRSPRLCSSGLVLQHFSEKKSVGDFSHSNKESGSKVFNEPKEDFVEQNSAYLTASTSASDEISEPLHNGNKPTVNSGVLPDEDPENSILSVVDDNFSNLDQFLRGWGTDGTGDGQLSLANCHGQPHHLLSLLHKRGSLADQATSLKLITGPLDRLHVSETGDNNKMLSISSKRNTGNVEKSLIVEQMSGGSLTTGSQSTISWVDQKSVGRCMRHDGKSDILPTTVDLCESLGRNSGGVISQSCAKHTGLGEIKGNTSVSLDCRNEPGAKLNSLYSYDGDTDLIDQICLPEEDSLITVDDFILSQDCINSDIGNMNDDLCTLSSWDIYDNLVKSDDNLGYRRPAQPCSRGLTSFYSSYDGMGLETSHHNLNTWRSYPQFPCPQMDPGSAFLYSSDPQLARMDSEFKCLDTETYFCNPQPSYSLMNELSNPFQYPQLEPTRFDFPTNHSLLQHIPSQGKLTPPHQKYRASGGALALHTNYDLAYYAGLPSQMQDSSLIIQQQCYGGPKLIPGHTAGGNSNHAKFDRFSRRDVKAKPRLAAYGQGVFSKNVNMGFRYER